MLALGLALAPAVVLLGLFVKIDRFPEPTGVILRTFLLGIAITVPSAALALVLSFRFLSLDGLIEQSLAHAFLGAAIPEELFKWIVVYFYCARQAAFDEPMDGLVYGATASLGFACLENVLYVTMSENGVSVAVLRALTAVPAHAAFGAIMGFFVAKSRFEPHRLRLYLIASYVVPVLLHGLYDFPIMVLRAIGGSIDVSEGAQAGLFVLFLAVLAAIGRIAYGLAMDVRAQQRHRSPPPDPADPRSGNRL